MVAREPGPHRSTPFLTLYSSLPGGLKGVLSCQDNQEHGRAATQTLRVVEAHAGVTKTHQACQVRKWAGLSPPHTSALGLSNESELLSAKGPLAL